jgi:hypothetical protein
MLYRLSYVRAARRIPPLPSAEATPTARAERLLRWIQAGTMPVRLAAAIDPVAHLVEKARAVGAMLVRDELAGQRCRWRGLHGTHVPVGTIHGLPHLPVDSVDELDCRPPPARSSSSAARARFSHGANRPRPSNEGSAGAVPATSTSFLEARHRGWHEGTSGRDAPADRTPRERHLGLPDRRRQTPLAADRSQRTVFPFPGVQL